MVKVGVGVLDRTRGNDRNGILGCKLVGFDPRPNVDLENGPCREVRPIPHSRVQLLGGVETFLKGRNDQIEWWIVGGVAVEPSDGTRKTYVRIDGFRVRDSSENPADTARIVRVPVPKGFQVPHTHQ